MRAKADVVPSVRRHVLLHVLYLRAQRDTSCMGEETALRDPKPRGVVREIRPEAGVACRLASVLAPTVRAPTVLRSR